MSFPATENQQYLSKSTIWLMTIGAGLVVANNYYNQPLLGMIAKEFGESESATSNVAMLTQMGYAVGLLLIIPLGDMFKRKRIILIDFIFIILSLLAAAYSQSLIMLMVASFFIGLTSVVPQIFVPTAAQLSRPEDKDKNVGQVMSGLLIGILGSRVISGILGEHLGWREMFVIAAGLMVILGLLLAWRLPEVKPTFKGTYSQLMNSIFYYAKTIPSLRLAALRGALGLASFSVFWTVLAFHLEQPPFMQGSDVAGLLGIVGISGALAASLIGHISGRINKNYIIAFSCLAMVFSWIVFGAFGLTYAGLIVGIIFLDMGLQAMHVTNQTIVFATHPEATNRLNTVYMVSYFVGGSIGTLLSGIVWEYAGWYGISILGASFVVLCLVVHLLSMRKGSNK